MEYKYKIRAHTNETYDGRRFGTFDRIKSDIEKVMNLIASPPERPRICTDPAEDSRWLFYETTVTLSEPIQIGDFIDVSMVKGKNDFQNEVLCGDGWEAYYKLFVFQRDHKLNDQTGVFEIEISCYIIHEDHDFDISNAFRPNTLNS